MADQFEAVVDNHGRLEHYLRNGVADKPIQPHNIGQYLLGGEKVVLEDIEYDLGETGTLVHPGVEVPDGVTLGSGVRIDEGTSFGLPSRRDGYPVGLIWIGDKSRVGGTEMFDHITVGKHALILARFISSDVVIGDHTRLAQGVDVLGGTRIGERVRVGESSWIAGHVKIGNDVRLADNSRVSEGAQIGDHVRINAPAASGPRLDQGGPFIGAGKIIESGTTFSN